MPRTIGKSARSGRIVSDAELEADPDGTYEQTTHPRARRGAVDVSAAQRPRTFEQRFGVGRVPKGPLEDRLHAWRTRIYAVAGDIQSSVHDEPLRDSLLASLEHIMVEVQKAIEEAE